MTLRTRLDRLDKILPRNSEQDAPTLDYSQLTGEEKYEMDVLLEKLDGSQLHPNDLSPLSDAERARLDELFERVSVET